MTKEQALTILKDTFPNEDPQIYSENNNLFAFTINSDKDDTSKKYDSQIRVINGNTGEIIKMHVKAFIKGE